jgi:uncharacterized protein YjbI with pentapeptide repeats
LVLVALIIQSFLVINSGADLSDADLRGADFSLANVSKVVLHIAQRKALAIAS